ncbi:MAG: hypothetical protein A2Y25_02910 [Candidatus Melainabacteria bacterium GWF2_37_15]|nr:MAG: hypothetical protein A2Y25_02910 [Candidatus Melainabacteria bacterium GWF2_37_15]
MINSVSTANPYQVYSRYKTSNSYLPHSVGNNNVTFSGLPLGITQKVKTRFLTLKELIVKAYKHTKEGSTNDFFKDTCETAIAFSTKIKSHPVKIKIRGKALEETLNLTLREYNGEFLYVLNNKEKNLAYVAFSEKGKSLFVLYINNEAGRKTCRGLEKTLLKALAEHRINQGKLPFIQGIAFPDSKINNAISSRSFHKILGAQKVGFIPGMIGISKEKDALELLHKVKRQGNHIFPETAENLDKLLDKF